MGVRSVVCIQQAHRQISAPIADVDVCISAQQDVQNLCVPAGSGSMKRCPASGVGEIDVHAPHEGRLHLHEARTRCTYRSIVLRSLSRASVHQQRESPRRLYRQHAALPSQNAAHVPQ